MLKFLDVLFGHKTHPPDIEAVRQSTERVIKASKEFRQHSTTLAKMVKGMQGKPRSRTRPTSKKTRE